MQSVYLDELGRAGSKAELDLWTPEFNSGGTQMQAQAAIASGVQDSAEAQDHLVQSWYLTYLGRAAQGGEENGWVGLLSQGQSEEQVLSQILASQEFYNRARDAHSLRVGGRALRPGAVPAAAEPHGRADRSERLGRRAADAWPAGRGAELPVVGGVPHRRLRGLLQRPAAPTRRPARPQRLGVLQPRRGRRPRRFRVHLGILRRWVAFEAAPHETVLAGPPRANKKMAAKIPGFQR